MLHSVLVLDSTDVLHSAALPHSIDTVSLSVHALTTLAVSCAVCVIQHASSRLNSRVSQKKINKRMQMHIGNMADTVRLSISAHHRFSVVNPTQQIECSEREQHSSRPVSAVEARPAVVAPQVWDTTVGQVL